nr:uncharacterized protein LOC110438088 [Danio rerio]XP_021330366.1 uncharacterized protein LOC110439296 [Danio rerio]|eukprot:XP_021323465.1 uncharacterized protein LOC110438088 [Danio rerio]
MKLIRLLLLITLLGLTQAHTEVHNLFWQYANWTARQTTNESCVVCQEVFSSAVTISLKPLPFTCIKLAFCTNALGDIYEWRPTCVSNKKTWELLCKSTSRKNHSVVIPTPRTMGLNILLTKPQGFTFSFCFNGTNGGNVSTLRAKDCNIVIGERDRFSGVYLPWRKNKKYSSLLSVCPRYIPGTCELNKLKCANITNETAVTACYNLNNTYCQRSNVTCVPTWPRQDAVLADDWYWYCGGETIFNTYPTNWTGLCTVIQLQHMVTVMHLARQFGRERRSVPQDDVPDEHRMRSHWTRFWEAMIPSFGVADALKQQEIMHYRLASFINSTTDAISGLREEMRALRLMTMQNRLALDMLLAERGGVCSLVGESQCCTYVPADDEDLGRVGQAVKAMKRISSQVYEDEMKERNFNWGWGFLESLFGSLAPYVSMVVPVLIIFLCVCIFGPCLLRCFMERMYRMVNALGKGYEHLAMNGNEGNHLTNRVYENMV